MQEFETFDFLVNDEDEVMLLFYEREGVPHDPVVELNRDSGSAILCRNEKDTVEFENISDDIFDSLEDADKLMVCELSVEENEENTQIIYVYEAEIRD